MHFIGFSGSLRKASYNSALLRAASTLLPAGDTLEILEIGHLSLYDQDLEANFPAAVAEIKEKMRTADGIIVATPEFNRSIPGPLKNMIDWTSRPYGDSSWKGKAALVMGASMGPLGTALAQYDLKKILLHLSCRVLGQPEIFIGTAQDKFDKEGVLIDESTKKFLTESLKTFSEFAQK
jgi:chromate reductase